MRSAVELADVHDIVLILENGGFIVVDVEVVGSAEDSHNGGEASGTRLAVHSVASILSLVGADDGEKIVLFQKCTGGRIREEVGAATDVVMNEELRSLLLAKLF